MRKLVLTLLLALGVVSLSEAQITANDMPQAGSSYNFYEDRNFTAAEVDPGNPGQNVTWNFNFQKDTTIVYNYKNPANTPYANDFPTATIALQYGNADAYGYAKVDANGVYDIGFAGYFITTQVSFPPTKFQPDPLTRMQFPASVGVTFNDQGNIAVIIPNVTIGGQTLDQIRVHSYITKTVEVDGMGTLVIGNNQFQNVYRYIVTEYRKDSIWAKPSSILPEFLYSVTVDTTVSFGWYDPAYKNDRLRISFQIGETTVTGSGTTAYKDTTVLFSDDISAKIKYENIASIEVFPNPATEKVYISAPNTVITNAVIYSVVGQEFKVPFTNRSVDISGLSEGMYILVITDQSGKLYRARIIKE